jgi:hypothetical protein
LLDGSARAYPAAYSRQVLEALPITKALQIDWIERHGELASLIATQKGRGFDFSL